VLKKSTTRMECILDYVWSSNFGFSMRGVTSMVLGDSFVVVIIKIQFFWHD